MNAKQLDKLLWRERLDKVFLWGLSTIILAALIAGLSYLRTNPSNEVVIEETHGKIVYEPSQGVEFYLEQYKVRLENGQIVKASGFGKVPNRYRGRVKLQRINSGGGDHYEIIGTVP